MTRTEPPESGVTPSSSQTAVVVEGIKQMIVDGYLAAGSRLPVEKDLAESLGVSRNSLREGIRALAIMGVVETRQGSGTFVTSLDARLLLSPIGFAMELHNGVAAAELHEVRRGLEADAAAAAAIRIDTDELERADQILDTVDLLLDADTIDHDAVMDADIAFHRLIANAGGNSAREVLIDALAARTVRARLWRALSDHGSERSTQAEHRAILDALASGRPDHARIRMENHLLGVEVFLRAREGDAADA